LPVSRLNATTGQFPFVKLILWQFNAIACRHRQLKSREFPGFVDRVVASELENDSLCLEPVLFNLQRSTTSIRRDCDDTLERFKTAGKIRQEIRHHFSAQPSGPGDAGNDDQIIGHFHSTTSSTYRRRCFKPAA